MKGLSGRRIRAIVNKELRTYRRSVSIVVTMAVIPLIFLVEPLTAVLTQSSAASPAIAHHHELLYLLAVPALVPAMLAAYAIVGERQQGTLEPLLGTPIRREELLLGKALAVLAPSVVIAYVVFAIFLLLVALFAAPDISPALDRPADIIAQVVFTPLIAALSIWVAMAISTRVNDIRAAQQLSVLASLPAVAVTTLLSLDTIHPSLRVALAFGVGLLLANRLAWRVVSALFDRERLLTGTR